MTATNHALTGALIGLSVHQPLLAMPAAILSHFIMDALPHFDAGIDEAAGFKSNLFRNYLIGEAFLCFLIVCALVTFRPAYWLLGSICAFFAAAPDLLSINHYLTVKAGKVWEPNLYSRFASKIQWFAKPIGIVVEAVWFIAAVDLLVRII